MPTFITYASYSQAGIKGMVDKPTDRTEAIKTLVEKAGGKLVTAYMTTGTNDVVLVTELPDGSDAVAVGMAAAASGAVSKIETVRAWTLGEFKGIAEVIIAKQRSGPVGTIRLGWHDMFTSFENLEHEDGPTQESLDYDEPRSNGRN